MDKKALLEMTADIVAAHASSNPMDADGLLANIHNVFAKLASLGGDDSISPMDVATETTGTPAKPAVPLVAAFGKDKIFCMICGKGMKTLKRHLSTAHGLKPGQYRKQFGIPTGTALVSSEYSDRRKDMAKDLNLAERLVKARAARGKGKNAEAAAKKPKAKKDASAPKAKRGRPAKKTA